MTDSEARARTEGSRVNKHEFLGRVAERLGLPVHEVDAVYDAMVEELLAVVGAGDTLLLRGFGKFYPHRRKGHQVQFAKGDHGGPAVIPDYAVLKFSAAREINKGLDEAYEQDEPPA